MLRDRLVRFYSLYNPSCVGTVDAIMANYAGREEELMRVLTAKYGPEPPMPSSDGDVGGLDASGGAAAFAGASPDHHRNQYDGNTVESTAAAAEEYYQQMSMQQQQQDESASPPPMMMQHNVHHHAMHGLVAGAPPSATVRIEPAVGVGGPLAIQQRTNSRSASAAAVQQQPALSSTPSAAAAAAPTTSSAVSSRRRLEALMEEMTRTPPRSNNGHPSGVVAASSTASGNATARATVSTSASLVQPQPTHHHRPSLLEDLAVLSPQQQPVHQQHGNGNGHNGPVPLQYNNGATSIAGGTVRATSPSAVGGGGPASAHQQPQATQLAALQKSNMETAQRLQQLAHVAVGGNQQNHLTGGPSSSSSFAANGGSQQQPLPPTSLQQSAAQQRQNVASSAAEAARSKVKARLLAFYSLHNPAMLPFIDDVLVSSGIPLPNSPSTVADGITAADIEAIGDGLLRELQRAVNPSASPQSSRPAAAQQPSSSSGTGHPAAHMRSSSSTTPLTAGGGGGPTPTGRGAANMYPQHHQQQQMVPQPVATATAGTSRAHSRSASNSNSHSHYQPQQQQVALRSPSAPRDATQAIPPRSASPDRREVRGFGPTPSSSSFGGGGGAQRSSVATTPNRAGPLLGAAAAANAAAPHQPHPYLHKQAAEHVASLESKIQDRDDMIAQLAAELEKKVDELERVAATTAANASAQQQQRAAATTSSKAVATSARSSLNASIVQHHPSHNTSITAAAAVNPSSANQKQHVRGQSVVAELAEKDGEMERLLQLLSEAEQGQKQQCDAYEARIKGLAAKLAAAEGELGAANGRLLEALTAGRTEGHEEGGVIALQCEVERLQSQLAVSEHHLRMSRMKCGYLEEEAATKDERIEAMVGERQVLEQQLNALLTEVGSLRLQLGGGMRTSDADMAVRAQFNQLVEELQRRFADHYEHRLALTEAETQEYYLYAKKQISNRDAMIGELTAAIERDAKAASEAAAARLVATFPEGERRLAEELVRLQAAMATQRGEHHQQLTEALAQRAEAEAELRMMRARRVGEAISHSASPARQYVAEQQLQREQQQQQQGQQGRAGEDASTTATTTTSRAVTDLANASAALVGGSAAGSSAAAETADEDALAFILQQQSKLDEARQLLLEKRRRQQHTAADGNAVPRPLGDAAALARALVSGTPTPSASAAMRGAAGLNAETAPPSRNMSVAGPSPNPDPSDRPYHHQAAAPHSTPTYHRAEEDAPHNLSSTMNSDAALPSEAASRPLSHTDSGYPLHGAAAAGGGAKGSAWGQMLGNGGGGGGGWAAYQQQYAPAAADEHRYEHQQPPQQQRFSASPQPMDPSFQQQPRGGGYSNQAHVRRMADLIQQQPQYGR